MTEQTTRRDVLKAAGTASALSGFALTATASEGHRVRVVEAGIRFDVPPNDNYDGIHVDSHPPFTIDAKERKLIVLNSASSATRSRIHESTDLLDERSADANDEITVGPRDGVLLALPTELSARMRVKRAVQLDSPVRIPTVTLNPGPNSAMLNVESKEPVKLAVGERSELRLDPVTAQARTSRVVGEATVEGVPEFMQGLERERDSVEIEATPIVEAINHGELIAEQQDPPPK